MATFTKFNAFVEDLAEKVHNMSNTMTVALTLAAPSATMYLLSHLSQISYTNLSTRKILPTSSSQTSGTYKLVLPDLTLTASGAVGPFRYIVIYDDESTDDHLVAYYDYGTSVTLASGDTFTIDFDPTNGFLTIV